MDGVVAPVDQLYVVAAEAVNVTLPPWQKLVLPEAVMVGVACAGFTVTVRPKDGLEVQPFTVVVTVYTPLVVTVMACVVSPLDQRFPVVADEVKVTLPPSQNVKAPVTVTVGRVGMAFIEVVTDAETGDVQVPLLTVTVYVPAVETVMDCVVAPVDQVFPVADDEVSTTLDPEQKATGPLAVMVGCSGLGFTVTVTAADDAELHEPVL